MQPGITMSHRIDELLDRLNTLERDRSTWESHWQDLAEAMLPRRADFAVQPSAGAKRTGSTATRSNQFDSTPMQAARGLAAALDGLLKPKTAHWFKIKTEDDALNETDAVKRWLEAAEARMRAALYDPRSRFLQRSAEVDIDLVVFGTGILFIAESRRGRELRFRSVHLKEAYLAENADGDIDTIFRVFQLTARQAEQTWGRERLGEGPRRALETGKPDEPFSFVHVVLPRADSNPRQPLRLRMPFASLWIDLASKHLLSEGGYHELPYVIPRWDTAAGEIYGSSPGMIALPDANTLNQMGKTLLKAGHKAVDPPLLVPNDGMKSARRTWPGGQTYFDAELLRHTQGRPPVFPLQTGANIPLGREMQNDTRDQVWAAFFKNVLNLPAGGPQMTATEILERKEEFVRVIGPTFGRLEADYIGPLAERTFNMLMRAGAFGPVELIPETLRGHRLRFEFVSPVARAVRQIESAALRKTIEDIAPLAAQDPSLLDHFDADAIARDVADANGVPQRWLKSREDVEAAREARAQTAALGQAASLLIGDGAPAAAP
jgi:hypothetical protein